MPGSLLGGFHELSHSFLSVRVLAVSFILQIRKLRAGCAKTHGVAYWWSQQSNQSVSDSKADAWSHSAMSTLICAPYYWPAFLPIPNSSHPLPQHVTCLIISWIYSAHCIFSSLFLLWVCQFCNASAQRSHPLRSSPSQWEWVFSLFYHILNLLFIYVVPTCIIIYYISYTLFVPRE